MRLVAVFIALIVAGCMYQQNIKEYYKPVTYGFCFYSKKPTNHKE